MTEPKPEVKMIYQQDQAVSVNAFMDVQIQDETIRLQISARHGAGVADIVRATSNLVEAYIKLRETYLRPTVPSNTPEPLRVPVDENGNEKPEIKVTTALRMSVEMKDGKYYYHVMTDLPQYRKYGISIWPEELKACNIDVTPGQPIPDIAGWRAEYIEYESNGRKRAKVTRLLPPK